MSNGSVSVAKVAQVLNLKNFTPDINLKKCKIISSDVNRPALQLTGYFEHFEESRIQMIGNVEYTFIQQMSDAEKKTRYDAFLKFDIPCVIFCRSLQPDEIFLEEAIKNEVPVLGTDRPTSEFMAELIYTLGEELAPCITVHGGSGRCIWRGSHDYRRQWNRKKRGGSGIDPPRTSSGYG